jgi:hypothetical protein
MQKSQKPGFAFLADIEKAFGSVCRNFIEAPLKSMIFGSYFVSWFITLHNKSTAKIIINGFLSDYFDIRSGVRQGCPWAPLLFLAATEPLACSIRDSQIGIDLLDGRIAYKGYANDTCCYVSHLQEIEKLFQIFQVYKEVSGLKLNESKSSVIPLGSSLGSPPPLNICCKRLAPGDHEAILGIQVGSLIAGSTFPLIRQAGFGPLLSILGALCTPDSRFATWVAGNPANRARRLGFLPSYKLADLAASELTDFLTFGFACPGFDFFIGGW